MFGNKIYIDLGAFYGGTINEFYETHSDAAEYLIYAWEPLVNNYKMLIRNIIIAGWDNIIPLCCAASNKDGFAKFYSNDVQAGDGGTLIDGKRTGALLYDKPLKVRCRDFCKWFHNKGLSDYYIYLKMNIEGGEYDILDGIIDSGVLNSISEFQFWLHLDKIEEGPQKSKYEQTHYRFLKVLENNHDIKAIRMS